VEQKIIILEKQCDLPDKPGKQVNAVETNNRGTVQRWGLDFQSECSKGSERLVCVCVMVRASGGC
jgi:hypothetical protein